jgi:PAS domain S-box-containing protein
VDSCPAPIAVHRDDRFLYVNAAFSSLLGYPDPNSLIGTPVIDVVHPEHRDMVLERIRKVREERVTVPFRDELLLHRDGSIVHAQASGLKVDIDGGPANMVVLSDITERRQVEAALRESEERLRVLTENLREATWLTDWKTKQVLYISSAYEHIWGRTCESLYAKPRSWADAIHPDDHAEAVRSFIEDAELGRYEMEYRIVRPDGEVRWIYDRAFPIRDEAGQVVLMAGVSDDVTERKNTEQAMLQVQKLESLGLLAGGIAHDFNNLLVGMLGFADLAGRHVPSSSPASGFLAQIRKAASSASDLCNQLLAYAGKASFVVGPVDLNSVCRDTIDLLSVSIPKDVHIALELDGELPSIEADATQMRQIIMNLAANASESIVDGKGSIRVRTGSLNVGEAYLRSCWARRSLAPGRFVFLEISDTGCGMDEDTQARLFDPFFSTKFTGRGLGMAALLGIVRGHRGTIRVDTELGKGTTMRVLFPASSRPVPAQSETRSDDSWSGGAVLVIDDDDLVRLFVRTALKDAGIRVFGANNARQGVALFEQLGSEIAVVLLDCVMPEASGPQVFDELRRANAEVPVVLTSGNTEQEALAEFKVAGPAGFIKKPYVAADLIAVLRQAVSGTRRPPRASRIPRSALSQGPVRK